MDLPIKIISTDFDGTFFAEFENPPVSKQLVRLIGAMQRLGARWVINTGRDLSSLMETLARARVEIHPDYVVVVEREIYRRSEGPGIHRFEPVNPWNTECSSRHRELFQRIQPNIAELAEWVNSRFSAEVYPDPYSPFCLIAGSNQDADEIEAFLNSYARHVPGLTVVRNDVYARFSHEQYNKGTALSEIGRLVGVPAAQVLAAGDHFNDLPMLQNEHARWLVAPCNAVPKVKKAVAAGKGYVSELPHGHGVATGIEYALEEGGVGLHEILTMG